MLRLGIDIDGVVADFQSAFRALAERELGRPAGHPDAELSRQDVDRLWKVVAGAPNWWMDVRPYEPEQIARLYARARQQRWEIFFMTSRPDSAGDSVQLQTQVWLEQLGFYLPTVLTMPNGARGEVARSLRLDLALDDRLVNCLEVVGASNAKAVLIMREPDDGRIRNAAEARGVGVVTSLARGLDAIDRLEEQLSRRRGRLLRLSDWFFQKKEDDPMLPHDPRQRQA